MVGNFLTVLAMLLAVCGIVLLFLKKWKIAILFCVLGFGWSFFEYWMFRGRIYEFTTTYPAACWTDDGKQIVYLINKELKWVASYTHASHTLKSKTYLCIMDADGRNKRVICGIPYKLRAGRGALWDGYWIECFNNKKITGGGAAYYDKSDSSSPGSLWTVNNIKLPKINAIDYGARPKWSVDGKYIIYEKFTENRKDPITQKSLGLWIVNKDGDNTRLYKGKITTSVRIKTRNKYADLREKGMRGKIRKSYLFIPFWWKV